MTTVLIEGAGLAGQVLHRELTLKSIPSILSDKSEFPRDKVCGGSLQWDSWEYLKSIFRMPEEVKIMRRMSHFWRGKKISTINLPKPMVYVSRYFLDHSLNAQQQPCQTGSGKMIRVAATGVESRKGDWIGFQGSLKPSDELEMHYGRGIYLGSAPTLDGESHAAWIVKKSLFKTIDDLRLYIRKELGVEVTGPLKGTRGILYHASNSQALAIGDAKLTTHPFLGLGMKHAILSARLMAHCIASGRVGDYPSIHGRLFGKYRFASFTAGTIYDSPLRFSLKRVLKHPKFFLGAYRWLHDEDEILRLIEK